MSKLNRIVGFMTLLKNIFYKNHKKIIIAAAVIFSVISFINLHYIINVVPTSNDECIWTPKKIGQDSVALYFNFVKFEGVSWDAGIRDGDRLVSINNITATDQYVASLTLNAIEEGHYAKYVYERDGEIYKTKVYVKKLIDFNSLGFSLMSIIWLFVAFFVSMAKVDGYPQRLFFRVALFLTVFSFSGGFLAGTIGQNPIKSVLLLSNIIGTIWIIAVSYLPFLIVHFFLIFPDELKIIKYKWTKFGLYLFPIMLIVVSGIVGYSAEDQSSAVSKMIGSNFLIVLCSFIIGLISLFINYMKIKDKKQRVPIFIILNSLAFGILAVVYSLFFAERFAGDVVYNSPEYFMPIVLIIIIPLSFGYSIFRYSLLDVSDVIKKTIIYGFGTVVLGILYFLLVYVLGQSASSVFETDYQGFIAAVFFIIFALGFQSSKDKLQEILTRKFYPEQFAFQEILLKFSKDVSSFIGLDNILNFVYTTFVEELNLTKFGIITAQNVDNIFVLKKSIGIEDKNLSLIVDEEKVIEHINEKKKLGLSTAIEREDCKKLFGVQCNYFIDEDIYIIIPMVTKSKLLGLLVFGLKYSGTQFAGKDLELLIAASNQITVSIENARLYESETEQLKYRRDLENAKLIQESLLPREIPNLKGLDISGKMIPAMQVGGDYFDLIKVSESKIFVIIGDVSGKGLAASFYMTKLQTMMRLFCTADRSPKDVLIDINREIYGSIERNWFITISVGLFDLETNSLKFCRAGHTPLLISRNGSISSIQSKGLGVGLESGIIFDSTLEEITIPLTEGQKFVFFSDGINEQMDEGNQLFGMKRFEKVLSENSKMDAENTLKSVLSNLNDYRNKTIQNDDITLVLVKIKG
ncbi:MAG: SpoIIE family protein phosphatase [Melioribacteraceae bacterium]|nr:SpoIIE family protein phosphatase [Melioribacteraceae bacterium]